MLLQLMSAVDVRSCVVDVAFDAFLLLSFRR